MDQDALERLNRANQELINSIDSLSQQDLLTTTAIPFGSAIVALIVALALALACAPFGAWIAAQKGRSRWEGALFAGAFGPIGMLIEALLPDQRRSKPRAAVTDPPWRQWDAESGDMMQAAHDDPDSEIIDWLNR